MTLDEEFEQNVEIVVEGLEYLIEIIEQQFIKEDLDEQQKENVIVKSYLVKGLEKSAAFNVSGNIFTTSSLWGNRFNEILMWLTQYMPQFKSKIEKQYSDIIKQVNAIPSQCLVFENSQHRRRTRRSKRTEEVQMVGLMGLENGIRQLANDLCYCAKMARKASKQKNKVEKPTADSSGETEQKTSPVKELGERRWKPPKGYIGSKEIVNKRVVPRTTLQSWQERDKLKVKKDPQTQENYYPKNWFDKHHKNYRPRVRKT